MKKLNHLDNDARNLLDKLTENEIMKNFVLVGGSGLAIHLGHRLSEDLDFFTNVFLDIEEVYNEMNSVTDDIKLIRKTRNQLDFKIDNTKITFCYQNLELLNNKELIKGNIYIANLETIAVLKILTLFLRAKFRDYYDIYFLNKEIGLQNLIKLGNLYIPSFQTKFFHNALTYIDDIEEDNIGYLRPLEDISINQIKDYFINIIKESKAIYD